MFAKVWLAQVVDWASASASVSRELHVGPSCESICRLEYVLVGKSVSPHVVRVQVLKRPKV